MTYSTTWSRGGRGGGSSGRIPTPPSPTGQTRGVSSRVPPKYTIIGGVVTPVGSGQSTARRTAPPPRRGLLGESLPSLPSTLSPQPPLSSSLSSLSPSSLDKALSPSPSLSSSPSPSLSSPSLSPTPSSLSPSIMMSKTPNTSAPSTPSSVVEEGPEPVFTPTTPNLLDDDEEALATTEESKAPVSLNEDWGWGSSTAGKNDDDLEEVWKAEEEEEEKQRAIRGTKRRRSRNEEEASTNTASSKGGDVRHVRSGDVIVAGGKEWSPEEIEAVVGRMITENANRNGSSAAVLESIVLAKHPEWTNLLTQQTCPTSSSSSSSLVRVRLLPKTPGPTLPPLQCYPLDDLYHQLLEENRDLSSREHRYTLRSLQQLSSLYRQKSGRSDAAVLKYEPQVVRARRDEELARKLATSPSSSFSSSSSTLQHRLDEDLARELESSVSAYHRAGRTGRGEEDDDIATALALSTLPQSTQGGERLVEDDLGQALALSRLERGLGSHLDDDVATAIALSLSHA